MIPEVYNLIHEKHAILQKNKTKTSRYRREMSEEILLLIIVHRQASSISPIVMTKTRLQV
jgi:hypothetical protein